MIRTQLVDPLVLLLLALSLGANVYLYRNAPKSAAAVEHLRPGDRVPSLSGTDLSGNPLSVTFESRPAVLYAFSPSCVWCDRNQDNATQLAEHVRGEYDFYAIAVDGTNLEAYVRERAISWRIIRDVPTETYGAYRMGTTPLTIVIDTGGIVRYVWPGAFAGSVKEDVERAFGLSLVGLRENATSAKNR